MHVTIPTDEVAAHFKQVIGPTMNTVLVNHLFVSIHIHSNKQLKKAAMCSTTKAFLAYNTLQAPSSIML